MEWISNSGTVEAVMAYVEDESELGAFDADGNPVDPDELLLEEDPDSPRDGETFNDYVNRIFIDDWESRER